MTRAIARSRPRAHPRARRDAETIQSVLADALLVEGYDWAAHDLRASIELGCRMRRGLAERILSEVLNGSMVLEHGEWNFPSSGPNPYVMILERVPIRFRGGTRHSSRRREPRIVIWSRYGNRPGLCRWIRYGAYDATEFGSMADAEAVARQDIASNKIPSRFARGSGDETMANLLFGPNPISDDELRRLIERRPEVYGQYARYLGTRSTGTPE